MSRFSALFCAGVLALAPNRITHAVNPRIRCNCFMLFPFVAAMPEVCGAAASSFASLKTGYGRNTVTGTAIIGGEPMARKITLNVNGRAAAIEVDDPQMPLLYALRNDLGLHGPRFGCGLAQCGACTVHVDGKPVRSCTFPVAQAAGAKLLTLEGLGTPERPHALQKAFIEEQAVQCGYCINGMIMQAAAFLQTNRRPTDSQIKEALADNMCRCGTHARIVRAVKRASESMA